MNVLYARNDHPGIMIRCPHCKTSVRHDSDDIGDAIKEGKPVVCVACDNPFYVFVSAAPIEAVEHSVQRTHAPWCESRNGGGMCDCASWHPVSR